MRCTSFTNSSAVATAFPLIAVTMSPAFSPASAAGESVGDRGHQHSLLDAEVGRELVSEILHLDPQPALLTLRVEEGERAALAPRGQPEVLRLGELEVECPAAAPREDPQLTLQLRGEFLEPLEVRAEASLFARR